MLYFNNFMFKDVKLMQLLRKTLTLHQDLSVANSIHLKMRKSLKKVVNNLIQLWQFWGWVFWCLSWPSLQSFAVVAALSLLLFVAVVQWPIDNQIQGLFMLEATCFITSTSSLSLLIHLWCFINQLSFMMKKNFEKFKKELSFY